MKMKARKTFLLLVALGIVGCQTTKSSHSPGGPYYFQSGVTYQGFRPTSEITKGKADELASHGYAYYIAGFREDGQPSYIEKIFNGRVEQHIDLVYSNGVLSQTITTDSNGIQRRIQAINSKK